MVFPKVREGEYRGGIYQKGERAMISARTFRILGMILYLLAIFLTYGYAGEGDTAWQINTPIDEILKANPLPLFVDDKWMGIKPGSFHFNMENKPHGAKNTGDEPLVVLIMFTPAMREVDRHFLK